MGGGVMRTVAKVAASVGYRTGHTPLTRAWEADEWELAGGEEEALFGTLHLSPPSLEEAKEAASDLKEALSGLYSPDHDAKTRFGRSAIEPRPGSSVSLCLEYSDAKKECAAVLTSSPTHIIQSFSLPPSAPRHVVKAFSLLQECPDVLSIVASLAVDEKIWDAVMKNDKVLKYCAANRISTECTQESVNASETDTPCPVDEDSPPSSEQGLIDFMQSIQLKVREMVSSLSDLLGSFMRPTEAAGSTSTTIVMTSTSNRNFEDMAAGASFVALTIATIILIILKRGDK